MYVYIYVPTLILDTNLTRLKTFWHVVSLTTPGEYMPRKTSKGTNASRYSAVAAQVLELVIRGSLVGFPALPVQVNCSRYSLQTYQYHCFI